jgi:hypothetical protein
MLGRTVRLVPIEPVHREELLKLVGDTTRAVVYGTGLTSIAQGALLGIGFAIAGLPSAVVFGVLTAFGRCCRWSARHWCGRRRSLYLAATSQWGWALFMLLWGMRVSVADNLLRPIADFEPCAGVDTRRVRRRHRRYLGLRHDRRDHRAGAVDRHRRFAALPRRDAGVQPDKQDTPTRPPP